MDSSTLEYLIAAGAALFTAALASSTSATLAALGEHRAESILDDREDNAPAGLGRVVDHPDTVRLALLALDSTAKIVFGVALALWAMGLAGGWLSAGLILVAGALLLLLVQTTARAFAGRDPIRSLGWAAPVAAGAELILRPLIAPLAALSRVVRGQGMPSTEGSTEQLEYLIEKGSESGVLDDDERDLLESVIEFSQVRVREIMVPRPKVVALAADASYEEVVRVVVESSHSRVPVFEDSVDNVVGVLYAKRLLEDISTKAGNGKVRFRLQSYLTTPFFVPETMRISHLLAEFQRRGLQIAVVVDEFGGTSGIVTLEDVVEEIVGDIRDEDDEVEQPIRVLADGLFLAEGGVSIRDAEEFLEEALPLARGEDHADNDDDFEFPEDGDYDTLGGFITAMAGRVPHQGETVRYGGLIFTVRAADEKRVLKVELSLESDEAAQRPESAAEPEAPEAGFDPADEREGADLLGAPVMGARRS